MLTQKSVSIDAENDKPLDSAGFKIELSKYGIFKKRRTVESKKVSCYQGVITKQDMQILEAQRQKTLDS